MAKNLVDPIARGKAIRKKMVDENGRVLCVNFAGTKLQKKDITKDLIENIGTGTYPFRAKINVKDFDADIRAAKGLPPFDFSNEKKIIETLNADTNFDIPLWFLRKAGDEVKNITLYDTPLIYQVMGCNFCVNDKSSGCLQCFVDNESNVPDSRGGVWLSKRDIADTFERLYYKNVTRVLRTSGGEPTLVLDHILALCAEIERRGLPLLLQLDTNLSTGPLIEYFEDYRVYPKNILNRIAEYGPCALVSLKGTNDINLQANTQAKIKVDDQIYSLKKLVEAGIDVYPSLYNTEPIYLEEFVEKLESVFENILLKTRVFMSKIYGPTRERICNIARNNGITDPKDLEKLVNVFVRKWDCCYEESCEIMDKLTRKHYGTGYKENERYGIKVKIRK